MIKKGFKLIIPIALVILIVLFIFTLFAGKRVDLNTVVKITVTNDSGVTITYNGKEAREYLAKLNTTIRVKKSTYIYNEQSSVKQIAKKDLTKKVSEIYYNKINKPVKHSLKSIASQTYIINESLNKKQQKAIIKVLGVDWFNGYTVKQATEQIVEAQKSVYVEFYPLMKYSQGYIENWYIYAKNKNIKICLEQKEIETYSPLYKQVKDKRSLVGIFNLVFSNIK